jgi:hypothetical protein
VSHDCDSQSIHLCLVQIFPKCLNNVLHFPTRCLVEDALKFALVDLYLVKHEIAEKQTGKGLTVMGLIYLYSHSTEEKLIK